MKPDLNSFVMVDPDKCVGCRACEIACAAKHRGKNNQGHTIGTMNGIVTPRRFLVKNKVASVIADSLGKLCGL